MIANYEQILCFAAVCKTGSITQAAGLLQCSKANVSRKITALEKRLGVKLLQRSTRSIYLTEMGARFKHRAIKIYDETRQLDKYTRDEQGTMAGKFVITAPVSLSTFIIAPILLKLQSAYPDIQFELIPTNENIKLIESEVDLAIRTGSVVDESMVARELGEFHEGFFTSSKNMSNYGKLCLEGVLNSPLLLNVAEGPDDKLNVFDNGKMLSLMPSKLLRIHDFQTSFNLLFDSNYIGWLPSYCDGVTRNGETITRLYPSIKGQPWPVYLVFPFQSPIPLKLRSIVDFIEAKLSPYFL